jgi:starch synthase
MADLGRNLPQAIQERGREIRTFMPKWGSVNERRNQLHEVIRLSGMNLIIDDTDHPLIIKVASIQAARMQVYFIDNDDYFQNREMTCNADGEEYDDNDERAIFYARGVLETVKKLRWCPELIHCHGWMSAFAPIYIKKAYSEEPSFRGTKVVFSLFGDGSDFRKECLGDLATKVMLKGIEREDITSLINTPANYEEICKLAVAYSDGLIVSSDSANQNVIAFARERGIPVLEYQGPENYADAYNQFFQEIIDAE